ILPPRPPTLLARTARLRPLAPAPAPVPPAPAPAPPLRAPALARGVRPLRSDGSPPMLPRRPRWPPRTPLAPGPSAPPRAQSPPRPTALSHSRDRWSLQRVCGPESPAPALPPAARFRVAWPRPPPLRRAGTRPRPRRTTRWRGPVSSRRRPSGLRSFSPPQVPTCLARSSERPLSAPAVALASLARDRARPRRVLAPVPRGLPPRTGDTPRQP